MIKNYSFYKTESGAWYIDLPDYPGEIADLQMVAGADVMLDFFADDKETVELTISLDEELDYALDYIYEPEGGGAWYVLDIPNGQHNMWLCDVTSWLFDGFPKVINFSVV